MAIMALATDYADLEKRLARIVVGQTYDGKAGDRRRHPGAPAR